MDGRLSRAPAAVAATALAIAAACAATLPRDDPSRRRPDEAGPVLRVALAASARSAQLSATGDWRVYDDGGRSVLLRGLGGATWRVESSGYGLRLVSANGAPSAVRPGPFIARPVERDVFVSLNGRRYRGEIAIIPTDTGLLVLNRVPLEWYLRGVVPLEIGPRTAMESAAVRAQAVASRTYALGRLAVSSQTRAYDVLATVADQVYGGVDAERPVPDAAITETAGEVVMYAGRLADARYHATCGGRTADASEAFRTAQAPYLRSVSDEIPGTQRHYCEIAPRYTWTRSFTAMQLSATLERYLRAYAAVPAGSPVGGIRALVPMARTASGRLSSLAIDTDAGRFHVRGNDIRYVLRAPSGEILNSTYFSVEPVLGRAGRIEQVTLQGRGNGHGVGMCQWGAIGRARAGFDYRSILQTYYPGTVVGVPDR